jgi:crotonobetainyl-CoA:carnitine CoA-transferase CaiB-like acyl-CoA transferase
MLAGVRVLDLTDERGFLAGKILGDLGADVIKIEPPGGDSARRHGPFLGGREDPERSLFWLTQNTSKRGIVLDLAAPQDRARFLALCGTADVVLESGEPGWLARMASDLDHAVLRRAFPRLIYCALSPFGQTGPYAHLRAHDLVVVAMGGNAAATGDPDRPPVRCTLPTATYHAAPEAALGITMALWQRETTGRGQLVDVSMHECQLQSLLSYPGQSALSGRVSTRPGPRIGRTREIWRARDGFITFGLRGGQPRIANLVATSAYMDECDMAPAWLRDYDWQSYHHNTVSDTEIARLEDAFAAFFREKTMAELYEQALARRILLAPCNDARAIFAQPQLRARELFVRVDCEPGGELWLPRCFVRSSTHAVGIRCRAPRLGEHQAEVLAEIEGRVAVGADPLAPANTVERVVVDASPPVFSGLRILELGSGAAAPVAARYFAEQGAEIIRVESTRRPDFLRVLSLTPGNPRGLDGAPMFILLNPNKRSACIDLKQPAGIALVERLVAWADVVSENFSPGVMARLGLDYDRLRRIAPGVILAQGSLFGQTGPERTYPGFGGQASAIAGFNHLTGWPDREAVGPFGTITDSLAPRYVALAITCALWARRRTGLGQRLDVSQIECGVYSLSEAIGRFSARGEIVTRAGNRDERACPHGIYPCHAGRFLAIAVHTDDDWVALARTLGAPSWTREPRWQTRAGRHAGVDDLDHALAGETAGRDAAALMTALQAAGVEAGVVQDEADLLADPQLAHRGHFRRIRHPALGDLAVEHGAILLSDSPRTLATAGPDLGAHTRVVLGEILGLSQAEIDDLAARGVLE